MKNKKKYIGCNYFNSFYYGGIDSSFDLMFTDEKVLIQNGIGDIIPCVIGDVSDAYVLLKNKLEGININNFEDISACIYEVVDEYFGGIKNINTRSSYYKSLDFIKNDNDIGRVSNLKGKGAAMCVERAMLSQNLLNMLGIKSFYKCSGIKNNDKLEVHSYNLVEHNDKYYVFDTSIPTIINDKINPLVASIPKDVYDMLSSPNQRIGYSVRVTHYNSIRNRDVEITYDYNRENIYNCGSDEKNKNK